MADYHGTARSNYFRVKDKQKFIEWCTSLELEPIYEIDEVTRDTLCGFIANTGNGAVPTHRNDEEFDFFSELSTHLADEEVGIVIEVGAEKMRYISGFADAVNSKGEVVSVCLDDIYKKAAKLGNNMTEAAY